MEYVETASYYIYESKNGKSKSHVAEYNKRIDNGKYYLMDEDHEWIEVDKKLYDEQNLKTLREEMDKIFRIRNKEPKKLIEKDKEETYHNPYDF